MTRSKIEFATILASLRGKGEDPHKLAEEMTLRKLCYEIEKAENETAPEPEAEPEPEVEVEAEAEVVEEPDEPPRKSRRPKSFWSRLNAESSEDES
jgi:hypothetical protein